MKIQFLRDHVAADGTQFRQGEVASVSPDVGNALVKAGAAKERPSASPNLETK